MHRRPRPRVDAAMGLPAVAFLTLLWSGLADGGYFSPAWGWMGLVLGWAAVMALILRTDPRSSRASLAFLAGLGGLLLWSLVSLHWSQDRSTGVEDVRRDLVYVMAALLVVAAARRRSRRGVILAITAGLTLTALYGLVTWLLPDRLGLATDPHAPGRLYLPLGYWNGTGLDAAMALVLLGGYLTAGRNRLRAALCAAAMPLVCTALFLTLSRGAIGAAVVGIAVSVIAAARPLRSASVLATLLPFCAAAVGIAAHDHALSGARYRLGSAHSAHTVAAELAVIALAAGAWGWYVGEAGQRWRVPELRPGRRLLAAVGVIALLAAVALVATGAAGSGGRAAYSSFAGASPGRTAGTSRVLSVSSTGRAPMWRAAWHDFTAHPLLGVGIGSFGQRWQERRGAASYSSRWAHSLYLETLAETGIGGIALLAAVFGTAVVQGIRRRSAPLVPAVVGALTAYLVHAASDWDWQLTSLTLAAVWLGACLVAGDMRRSVSLRPRPRLAAALALGVAGTCAAVYGLAGASALAAADAAARAGHPRQAIERAHQAARLQPWSEAPWMVVGETELARGRTAAAVQAYETATRRAPDRWDAWLGLASAAAGAERAHALLQAERLAPHAWQVRAFCKANAQTLTLAGAPASDQGCGAG